MNKLDTKRRAQILTLLCEGMSVRATCRVTGAEKKTVLRLLVAAGRATLRYQQEVMRELPCKRIQCDEIWSFVAMKQKNVPKAKKARMDIGDVWTWTPMCADTKLVPCFLVGPRDASSAYFLMKDLESRLLHRVQLTTDGHGAYLSAVEANFGRGGIDYAKLVKHYGTAPEAETRYSPAVCIGCEKEEVFGNPDPAHISTSYVERQNLTIRMQTRRFTRLTNAFSKKFENHCHALALFYMFYNFARVHQTLRCTPAMEAGIADHIWTMEEIADLITDGDMAKEKQAA